MVNLVWAERKAQVLSSSGLACLTHTPTINLTSGCAHDCIYCYARGYTIFPGENRVVIYKNTLAKIKIELPRKKIKPQFVYFSPSSDIFQPIPEVLELSHSILEFLLSNDIGIAFVTKGIIPGKTLELLLNHSDKVRAQIGIITHDDYVRSIFEPNAADIKTRLTQMAKLRDGGIAVEARIIPILPGITDDPSSIDCLCAVISNTGVKQAAISTLFLRPAIITSLKRHISNKETMETLLSYYSNQNHVAVQTEHSSIIPLPKQKREEIYSRFHNIARKYAINLAICGCMNPDIGGLCNIMGKWTKNDPQQYLFE